jgi:hypothetical protein
MIVEVGDRRFELDWKDAAVLLALLWVRFRALSPSHLHAVEADSGRLRARVERLKSMGLVDEVRLSRGSMIYLTDLGYEVALLLEKKAAELNVLKQRA